MGSMDGYVFTTHGTSLAIREPCAFLRPNGLFGTYIELTGLTSRGTFVPPRCGIMT